MANRMIHWATDANYAAGGDPWSGQPNKVLPSAGQIQSGFVPNAAAPAEYENFLFHVAANAINGVAFADIRNWSGPLTYVTGSACIRYTPGIAAGKPGKYYVAGGITATFSRSPDPLAPTTTDEFAAAVITFGCGALARFDVAPDGTIVLPGSGNTYGKNIAECNATGTWTVHATVLTNFLIQADVVFDVPSGNWILAGERSAGAAIDFYTSTNRTAWTARTAPTGAVASSACSLTSNGLGTVVCQEFEALPGDNATNFTAFSASVDGGVTWSALDIHVTAFATAGFANTPLPKPVWTGTHWVAYVANEQDVKTYVYNSLDGITWTQVALLTSVAFKAIASDGDGDADADSGLILALCRSGMLVYSLDAGVTWTDANMGLGCIEAGPARNYNQIFALNGGFAASDNTNSKVRFSLARKGGGGAVIT